MSVCEIHCVSQSVCMSLSVCVYVSVSLRGVCAIVCAGAWGYECE